MPEKRHIKVLHIASGDLWAGAEVQLYTLATALQKIPEVKVSIVLLNHGKLETELQKSGIEVLVLDESRLNSIQILRQLINHVKTNRPDIIHTHRTKENVLGSIAALFCGRIPSLRTQHGAQEHHLEWYQIPQRIIRFLDRFCGLYLQQRVISVSEDLEKTLQSDFPASHIDVIENGIDLAILPVAELRVTSPVNEIPKQSFRIGIAGRLVPVKRVDLFLEAAAALLRSHPELDASFHIFGDGPLHSELVTLSQNLGIEKDVYFEGHSDNIHQDITSLDILLITSDHEGLPMILLEAMSLKTPVIAHAVGGIPAVLNGGECGVLISEHSPSAYAEAIFQLLTNKKEMTIYINNAFERVNSMYSSQQNAKKYHEIYNKLLV